MIISLKLLDSQKDEAIQRWHESSAMLIGAYPADNLLAYVTYVLLVIPLLLLMTSKAIAAIWLGDAASKPEEFFT